MSEAKHKLNHVEQGQDVDFFSENRTIILIVAGAVIIVGFCFAIWLATGALMIIVPENMESIWVVLIHEPITDLDYDTIWGIWSNEDIAIYGVDEYDPIRPGEQVTVDAPAGVWSISAWRRDMEHGGYFPYDAEMQIDMREDTEWIIENHPELDYQ